MKFTRRPDLTTDVRINIAIEGLANLGTYGFITKMAEAYNVSRTFVYTLIYSAYITLYAQLVPIKYPDCPVTLKKREVDKEILLQRLEGNSSIESISNILSYHNTNPSSVGYISQCLASYGNALPDTLEINSSEEVKTFTWLNDEIFPRVLPVLMTIEPNSLAIVRIHLADKRDSSEWKNHFSQLQKNGFSPQALGSDRGQGIVKACQEMFPYVNWQPDIFHDIRELSRAVYGYLQREAYKAIALEYKREDALSSAKSISVQAKRLLAHSEAKEQAGKAIALYDDASYLLDDINEQLEFIDKQGNFRNPQSAQQNISAGLELLISLGDIKVLEAAYKLKANLGELLLYMNESWKTYQKLSDKIADQELLQSLCLAWRCEHKLYQNPTLFQKKYLIESRNFSLEYSQVLAGKNYNDFKEQVFSHLDNIIRASSLVENVNSIIRPYFDTCKGQITQGMLNLIMFYHNYRKFDHGKRKGKAPLEILTGQEIKEHWVDILVDKVGNL